MVGRYRSAAVIAWVAGGAALLFGVGVLVVGVAMALSMDDGMMHGGGNAGPQTPFIASSDVSVSIRDFEYSPRDLVIPAGSTVTWKNYDSAPHTSTDRDDQWDTGNLGKDEEMAIQFNEAGIYAYYCVYHTYMEARLTVR
jgi:plastocyanin